MPYFAHVNIQKLLQKLYVIKMREFAHVACKFWRILTIYFFKFLLNLWTFLTKISTKTKQAFACPFFHFSWTPSSPSHLSNVKALISRTYENVVVLHRILQTFSQSFQNEKTCAKFCDLVLNFLILSYFDLAQNWKHREARKRMI